MLEIKNLTKVYQSKKAEPVTALNNISLSFSDKGMVFLLGKSGSGKSTLLNVLGGLDKFNSGEIIIDGKSSKTFKEKDFDAYRNTYLGFIFQEYNILSEFTVEKNIEFALELQGKKADKKSVADLLEQVDLTGYGKRKPNELSGGQKQRIAIARALIKNPQIIMADEPTGALDSKTGKQVLDTLKKLSEEKLVIIVSHDREFAEFYADRIIELKDGNVISDTTKRTKEPDKTNNGFNMVDDHVIHIEKDHKFTKTDVDKLIDFLKSSKSDVILTADEKLNTEVKKIAKIDANGNREYFDKTQATDIKQDNQSGLKLIKSRLKYKDSFKMGASGLKTKKFRLFMTILLSAVALTLFGLADTMASFNVAQSSYDSLRRSGADTLSINLRHLQHGDGYVSPYEENVGDFELEYLRNKYPDYTFTTIYSLSNTSGSSSSWTYDVLASSNHGYNLPTELNGITTLSDDDMVSYKLQFLTDSSSAPAGHAPRNDNEIVISDYHYALMKAYGLRKSSQDNNDAGNGNDEDSNKIEVKNLSDIIGKTIHVFNGDFVVVGVTNNNFDLSKYESLQKASDGYTSEAWNMRSKLENEINQDFGNVFILSQKAFDAIATPAKTASSYERSFVVSDEYDGFQRTSGNWGYLNDQDKKDNKNIIFFDGNRTQGLADNEVLISASTSIILGDSSTAYQFNVGYTSNNNQPYYGGGAPYYGDDSNNTSGYTFEDGTSNVYETPEALKAAVAAYFTQKYGAKYADGKLPLLYLNSSRKVDKSKDLKVVGIYYDFDQKSSSNSYYGSGTLYFKDLQAVPSEIRYAFNQYSSIMVKLLGNTEKDKKLIMALSNYDSTEDAMVIRGKTGKLLEEFSSSIKDLSQAFIWVGVVFAAFAALMLMNFIGISISYKKKEIGILRALGARGSDVYGIFLHESMIITIINFIVATIATVALTFFINDQVGTSLTLLSFGIRQVLLMFAISIVVALVASFLPTHRISRMKPIDAILDRKTK